MNFIHGEIAARDGALAFAEPSGSASTLPKSREAAYARSVGKPMVLGFADPTMSSTTERRLGRPSAWS